MVGKGKDKKKIKPTAVIGKNSDELLEEFIQACLKADPSEDMSTIIEKKVRKHYHKVHPSYRKSSAFLILLKNLSIKVINDEKNLFCHISDLTSELKARKDTNDAAPPPTKKQKRSEKKEVDYDLLESKRNELKIKKLNNALAKLQRAIHDLETKEVEWEDDDNSSYIQLQRYKERAVKVFNKLCDITKESKSAGVISRFHFSGTCFPEVNKCIEKFVNETKQFPDYVDIVEVIKAANDKNNMKLSDLEIGDMARTAFTEVGEELQRQRKHSHTESLLVLIEGGIDPADSNKDLADELSKNRDCWQNINKVIDEFAEKASKKKGDDKQSGSNEEEEDGSDKDDDDEDDDDEESDEDKDDLSNLSAGSNDDEEDDDGDNIDDDDEEEEEEAAGLADDEADKNNDVQSDVVDNEHPDLNNDDKKEHTDVNEDVTTEAEKDARPSKSEEGSAEDNSPEPTSADPPS